MSRVAFIQELEVALRKIADLVDSEAGEPLDDAIGFANAALNGERTRPPEVSSSS